MEGKGPVCRPRSSSLRFEASISVSVSGSVGVSDGLLSMLACIVRSTVGLISLANVEVKDICASHTKEIGNVEPRRARLSNRIEITLAFGEFTRVDELALSEKDKLVE